MSTSIPFTLVASDAALRDCCQILSSSAAIAVDTEFMRTRTYYARLGLVQLANREHCWLVDPLAIADLDPLRELLQAPSVLKVLHSCSEDLQVLQSSLGVLPTPLLDTQVAAGFVGEPFAMGYGRIVQALLGVELSQQETRSDWLQRPLSESQLHYAAEDVHYLIRVYEVLAERIERAGRRAWVEEDMATLLAAAAKPDDPMQAYLRIKAAWQLDRAGLAVLQVLTAWRETQAQATDLPRSWVIADRDLMELAETRPANLGALAAVGELPPKLIRRHGEHLLGLIRATLAGKAENWPGLLPERLPRHASSLLKALRQQVDAVAGRLELAPELLARKKDLEPLVRAVIEGDEPQLTESLAQGWRRDPIGKPLLALVQAAAADFRKNADDHLKDDDAPQ